VGATHVFTLVCARIKSCLPRFPRNRPPNWQATFLTEFLQFREPGQFQEAGASRNLLENAFAAKRPGSWPFLLNSGPFQQFLNATNRICEPSSHRR
jgi:hypothetical protein